jgi:hypothetical protein
VEIGVYSFELRGDAAPAEQRLRNLIEEIELAGVGRRRRNTRIGGAQIG